jgi:hypothetical protein
MVQHGVVAVVVSGALIFADFEVFASQKSFCL